MWAVPGMGGAGSAIKRAHVNTSPRKHLFLGTWSDESVMLGPAAQPGTDTAPLLPDGAAGVL